MVDDTVVDSHPEIKTAVATLRQRYLDNSRSTIVAPVSGYVAKRAVQLGMRVTSGTTLLAIVPLNEVWVDANFKESQMQDMRIGQKVELNADLYGDNVKYHGTIESLGIGTGSAFTAASPERQRQLDQNRPTLPVRITLDPHDMQKHPLRVGLSMNAEVDIRNQGGHLLPQKTVEQPRFRTDVYETPMEAADKLVAKILHDNTSAVAQR
jgi:membrane fusion protein (multidrug efflux system)